MRTAKTRLLITVLLLAATPSLAGEAGTWATAASSGRDPGTAAAGATYTGNGLAFTDTYTRSGALNLARGVSLGLDEEGLSFSTSYAVAPRVGPAVGGTFNMFVGLDGETSTSTGQVVATNDPQRSVSVNGRAGRSDSAAPTLAAAAGTTGPRGTVQAETRADHAPGFRGEAHSTLPSGPSRGEFGAEDRALRAATRVAPRPERRVEERNAQRTPDRDELRPNRGGEGGAERERLLTTRLRTLSAERGVQGR